MKTRLLYLSGVAVLCAWVLGPIYLIALSAVGGRRAVFAWPKSFWPSELTFDALLFFFQIDAVWQALLNSAITAGLTMLLAVALGAPAGYALARYAFAGKTPYRLLLLATRAFPVSILALPLTVTFIQWNLYDTPLGVAIVHTGLALPFAALVTSSLFMGIPVELEEAAWVFGCSRARAFMKVVAPLALPGIAATAVFAFVISWNEVFAASVLTVRHRTLTAYLIYSLGESPLHFKFAGGLFLIVPVLVFIFAVRRYLFSMWGIASR
jgi:multiple sugar transport system permease protein